LILKTIIKIIVIRSHILKLQWTKFYFGLAPHQISLGSLHGTPQSRLKRQLKVIYHLQYTYQDIKNQQIPWTFNCNFITSC